MKQNAIYSDQAIYVGIRNQYQTLFKRDGEQSYGILTEFGLQSIAALRREEGDTLQEPFTE